MSQPGGIRPWASTTSLLTPSSPTIWLHISVNTAACTEHNMPYTNRHEAGACQELVIFEHVPRWYSAPGTWCYKDWTSCVDPTNRLLSNLSAQQSSAPLRPPSFSLFHCCPNIHHHLTMTTARLKTSLQPGNHGNALRTTSWPATNWIWALAQWVGPCYPGPHCFTARSFQRPHTLNPAATPRYSKPPRVVRWRLACF